jgi:hypothetical protein
MPYIIHPDLACQIKKEWLAVHVATPHAKTVCLRGPKIERRRRPIGFRSLRFSYELTTRERKAPFIRMCLWNGQVATCGLDNDPLEVLDLPTNEDWVTTLYFPVHWEREAYRHGDTEYQLKKAAEARPCAAKDPRSARRRTTHSR